MIRKKNKCEEDIKRLKVEIQKLEAVYKKFKETVPGPSQIFVFPNFLMSDSNPGKR